MQDKQEYSSKDTSLNVVNKVYTQYNFKPKSIILDYGGGKYDTNVEYMEKLNGSKVYVYDKYNRTEEHNEEVFKYLDKNKPDYVICSNVLNVIKEDSIIEDILKTISEKYPFALVLIKVYEKNKSGVHEVTSKGYQRNEKTEAYIPVISKYFDVKSIKNGILECISLKGIKSASDS